MSGRRTLALAFAVTALAAGCGGGSKSRDGSAKPSLNVGYAFAYDTGDVADRIAFARLERRSGIRVRIRELGGVANAVVALVRGDVQLAAMPYSTAIRAVGERASLHVVLGQNMASELMLVGRDGIDDVQALRGRRVADDGPGLDGETLVLQALAQAGVPRAAVRLMPLGATAAQAAALQAGRADAATLEYVDYERLLARDPGLTVLARLSAFRPRSAQTVWVVSDGFARMHPELLRRVVDGLLDGYAFAYRPAGRRAWIRVARRTVLHGDASLAARAYDYDRRVRFWPLRDEPVTAAEHRRTVRFWLRTGQLDRSVPFARVWDAGYWRAAER